MQLIFGHGRPAIGRLLFGRALFHVLGQLVHVIIHGLPHLVHQLLNFLRARPAPDRLGQPFLRALQPLLGIVEIALLNHQRDLPQLLGHLVAQFRRQAARLCLQPPHGHPQPQPGLLVGDHALRRMGDGAQDLHRARGIGARPHQIAPHLDQGRGDGVKEPLAGQRHRNRLGNAFLPRRIHSGKGQRHRQIGQHRLRQIIHQRADELFTLALARQGQVQHHRGHIGRIGGQTKAAVHLVEIQRNGHLTARDAIVVADLKLLLETPAPLAPDLTLGADGGGAVGGQGNLPFSPARSFDGQPAALHQHEILHGF